MMKDCGIDTLLATVRFPIRTSFWIGTVSVRLIILALATIHPTMR